MERKYHASIALYQNPTGNPSPLTVPCCTSFAGLFHPFSFFFFFFFCVHSFLSVLRKFNFISLFILRHSTVCQCCKFRITPRSPLPTFPAYNLSVKEKKGGNILLRQLSCITTLPREPYSQMFLLKSSISSYSVLLLTHDPKNK